MYHCVRRFGTTRATLSKQVSPLPFSNHASLIYHDRGILVLNKPPGIISQLGTGTPDSSVERLLADIRHHYDLQGSIFPVHRLDKNTSGCLVFARSQHRARDLSQQFEQGQVKKTYLALVRGGEKTFPGKEGQIRVPLQYIDGRPSIGNSGKPSATDWELLASSPHFPISLVRLHLITGYKHQLRVHLAHSLKAPILGDDLYSRKPVTTAIRDSFTLPEERVFLHASKITLSSFRPSGPKKHLRLGIQAPLPDDFLQACSEAHIKVPEQHIGGGLFVDDELVEDGCLPALDGQWVGPHAA